jgi:TetR/AcrR family transcriptional regulator
VKSPPVDLAERLVAASSGILGQPELRLEDVAATVGVARTTLYYYFSGRDDLVSFLLSRHIQDGADVIRQAAEGADSPATQLHAVTVALVEFIAAHPGLCAALLATLGAAGRMDEALQANEALIAAPVRELVTAGIAAGDLRDGDPADITNALLGGILLAVLARTVQHREVTPPVARRLSDILLHGAVP